MSDIIFQYSFVLWYSMHSSELDVWFLPIDGVNV